jgi:hypothetical protein
MKARMGTPKAMTATAHNLARIVCHMVTTQQPYDTTIFQKQEERRLHQKSARLHAQDRELGFQLVHISFVLRIFLKTHRGIEEGYARLDFAVKSGAGIRAI